MKAELLAIILISALVLSAGAGSLAVAKLTTDVSKGTAVMEKDGKVVSIATTKTGIVADKYSDSFASDVSGSKVVFHSWATNLDKAAPVAANVYLKDTTTGDIKMVKAKARMPTMSGNGRYLVYEYTDNYDTGLPQLMLYDTTTGKETFIAYTSGGNAYGWKTQEFTIVNNDTVYYETSYPYPGVEGFTKRFYTIPKEKEIITEEIKK